MTTQEYINYLRKHPSNKLTVQEGTDLARFLYNAINRKSVNPVRRMKSPSDLVEMLC